MEDPVSLDEPIYPHRDMDLAQAVIAKLRREKKDALRTLWLVVMAAGGEVKVSHRLLMEVDDRCVLERTEEPYDLSLVFRAREGK